MDLAFSHPIRVKTGGATAQRSAAPRAYWRGIGLAAVLTSGAALAALPTAPTHASDDQRQWQALAITPLSAGGTTGLRMAPTGAVAPIEVAPERKAPFVLARPVSPPPADRGPMRIRGRVGDGLYWSLRAAGASPQAAAQYLAALATEVDVGGDIQPGDGFDLVVGSGGLLYAGLDRSAASDLQLVRWSVHGQSEWIDAANADRPSPVASGLILPAAGRITSYFGSRVHPILRFVRFHAGLDIGAGWG
ncbi:MAG: M23 family metallopeptidase, partial [Sphingomicrobium sp.]